MGSVGREKDKVTETFTSFDRSRHAYSAIEWKIHNTISKVLLAKLTQTIRAMNAIEA